MKRFLFFSFACLVLVVNAGIVAANGTDEFDLSVRLTTGEHSRDSSSQTTTITIVGNAIVWKQSFGGRRRITPAASREFRLSPADKRVLIKLVRSNNLLATKTIELPRNSSNFRYFEISVDSTLNGRKSAITISGMRTAVMVKEEKLYQNSMALVTELYRIINTQDQSILFEELVHDAAKR